MAEITLEDKTQYENFAPQYDSYEVTPSAKLEAQYVEAAFAMMDIKGKIVLDLGGGTGLRARQAIEAGAARVDLVDVSSEMIKIAQAAEEQAGRKDSVRFFTADASGDISSPELGLLPQYEVVMVNWLLDHSTSNEDLEAFWRNIALFTKPGGRFMNIRTMNPRAPSITTNPKYGVEYRDLRSIPGGEASQIYIHADPPLTFEATLMRNMYIASSSAAMYEKYGFEHVHIIDPKEMGVVREDPAFWQVYLDDPFNCCVIARKKADS